MYCGKLVTVFSYSIYAALTFASTGIQKSVDQINSRCGNVTNKVTPLIIGGEAASPAGNWPWMASIFYKPSGGSNNTTNYGCGGSLIADQWILTAGHCVNVRISHVRLGDLYINETASAGAIEVTVQNQIVHPNFQTYPNQLKYDIALLYLSEPVKCTDKIYPICLPRHDDIYEAREVYANGWGFTVPYEPTTPPNTTSYSPVLKHACVRLISHYICKVNYAKCPGNPHNDIMSVDGPKPPEVSERVLCAGGPHGEGSCTGDSGGPLVFRDEEKDLWFQGGIVSFNCGCGDPKWPGGYTRVTSYFDWIERMTRTAPLQNET